MLRSVKNMLLKMIPNNILPSTLMPILAQWWPGGLGKVSTHALTYARLLTDGRDYGVHGNTSFKVDGEFLEGIVGSSSNF